VADGLGCGCAVPVGTGVPTGERLGVGEAEAVGLGVPAVGDGWGGWPELATAARHAAIDAASFRMKPEFTKALKYVAYTAPLARM
jgi:hypothetical protein